jgi:hypothetical protein
VLVFIWLDLQEFHFHALPAIDHQTVRLSPLDGIMVMVSTRWKNIGWQGGTSMSAEKNKALVRRFLKAHAKGEIDTLEQMLAPTSSTTTYYPANGPAARATCGHLPSIMLPTPTPAMTSRSSWPKGMRW